MNLNELSRQIKSCRFKEDLEKDFPKVLLDSLDKMNAVEIEKMLDRIIKVPVTYIEKYDRKLYQFYYCAAWFNIYEKLSMPKNLCVLEIATGEANYVIKALDVYSGSMGKYVTFNLNRELTKNFIDKTRDMAVEVQVVEDNGNNALNYYEENSFDVIAFHHAVNDIVQTIIADIEGIDTINQNWWETETQMLQAVMKYYNQGKLKAAAYDGFIEIIRVCSRVLKKKGYMVFDNRSFCGYEERGYSTEFHNSYINLAREWIKEADLGLEQVHIDGYDENWWMILKKV